MDGDGILRIELETGTDPVLLGSVVRGAVVALPGLPAAGDRLVVDAAWGDWWTEFRPAGSEAASVLHEGPLPAGGRFPFQVPVGTGPLGFQGTIRITWAVQARWMKGDRVLARAAEAFPTAAPVGGDVPYRLPPGVAIPDASDVAESRKVLGRLGWGLAGLAAMALVVPWAAWGASGGDEGASGWAWAFGALMAVVAAWNLPGGLRNLAAARRVRGLALSVPAREVRWGGWARAEVRLPPGLHPAVTARVVLEAEEGRTSLDAEVLRNVFWTQSEAVARAGDGGTSFTAEFRVPEGAPPSYRTDEQWVSWRLVLQAWAGEARGEPAWTATAPLVVRP